MGPSTNNGNFLELNIFKIFPRDFLDFLGSIPIQLRDPFQVPVCSMSICGCGLQLPGTHWVQEFLLTHDDTWRCQALRGSGSSDLTSLGTLKLKNPSFQHILVYYMDIRIFNFFLTFLCTLPKGKIIGVVVS